MALPKVSFGQGCLGVMVVLLVTLPLSHSWLVRCPAIFSNPVVTVLSTTMMRDKTSAAKDDYKTADGTLKITVYSGRSKGTDVKFELTSNDLFYPLIKTINMGGLGVKGEPVLTIPGFPTIALRADGITYKITSWIKNADSVQSLKQGSTVTQVLSQMDASPSRYYVTVSPFAFLGSLRGQLGRAAFVPCMSI